MFPVNFRFRPNLRLFLVHIQGPEDRKWYKGTLIDKEIDCSISSYRGTRVTSVGEAKVE